MLATVGCVQYGYSQSNYIDSLQQIASLQKHDSIEIQALLNLSNEFLRKDIAKSKMYAFQALKVSNAIDKDFGKNGAYIYLVAVCQNEGKIDSAQFYLNQAYPIATAKTASPKMMANYNQSAGLFYKNLGEYKKALPYLLDNLNLLKKEDEGRAGNLLNIGNTYINLGDFKNAATYQLQALAIFEKIGNKRGQSFGYHSLGRIFLELNQTKRARDYYERSAALKKELDDKRGLITTRTGLGDVNRELNQFNQSEYNYSLALQGAQEMKLQTEEARVLHQYALLDKKMGNLAKADEKMTRSLALAKLSGDSTMTAQVRSQLIGLRLSEQNEKQIESSLISNLNTVINSGDRGAEAIEYSRLSDYYAANKQFDKAYEYEKKYEELKDTVQGSVVVLQIRKLEEQFETEKKEKEIALLKKDKELHQLELSRERANVAIIVVILISVVIISALLINRYRVTNKAKRILEMERMRNGIARDLHDDIGSTLSSINILSQLALQTNNGESIKYFQRIHEHSGQIMERMSDIVWSINPNNDSFDQVIVKMKEFAGEILEPKNISYSFEEADAVRHLALTIEKRKNIFLIFKEAVNNAAKYSEGSLITIRIWVESEKIQLSISDNGNGFDAMTVKPGNGLKNMEARAANIFGTLQRTSGSGAGTSIKLEVPIT